MRIAKNLTKWQNYAHYIILTLGVMYVINYIGISNFTTFDSFIKLVVAIFLIDTVIHYTFAKLPRPYKWED